MKNKGFGNPPSLKEYLQYVFKQYTSHKMEYPRYNMLTNQQMELNHAIRKQILKES
jgi:hypothetical protein